MIASVEVCEFKETTGKIELDERNLLMGPNGSGKSTVIEALKFCLTGHVPSGKTKDDAAKYFGPRGGWVKVVDDSGSWIMRTLVRDHEKNRVSIKLELFRPDDREPTEEEWTPDPTVLEIGTFLEKSSAKRRAFVLELVGGGEAPTLGELHADIGTEFARLVAGEAATVATLEEPDDLTEETAAVVSHWPTIWGTLRSYLSDDKDASAIWISMGECSRLRKLDASAKCRDAKAAIRELEAEAKGARAAAAHVEGLEVLAGRLKGELERAESIEAMRAQKGRAREALETGIQTRARNMADATAALTDLGPLGDEPVVSDIPEPEDVRRLREERVEVYSLLEEGRQLEALRARVASSRKAVEVGRQWQSEHKSDPIGRIVKLVGELVGIVEGHDAGVVPAALQDTIEELREPVALASRAWGNRARQLEVDVGEADAELSRLIEELGQNDEEPRPDVVEQLEHEIEEHQKLQFAALERFRAAKDEAAAAHRDWRVKSAFIRQHEEAREKAEKSRSSLSERLAAIDSELEALEEVDVGELKTAALKADWDRREALKAAGAVEAYYRAKIRASDEKSREAAWAAAERSVARAREVHVAGIVAPIKTDIQRLLDKAGREERVYLELENDRGAPIFDLGWDKGDSRRSLDALSGGEALLFVSALALAIAARTKKLKLLLVEADPLDDANLAASLKALVGMAPELDACIASVCSDSVPWHDGWKVTFFGPEPITATPETKVRAKKTAAKKKRQKREKGDG